MDPVDDRQTLAAGLVLSRCDTLDGHEEIVQPPRSRESGVEGGIEDAAGALEGPLGVFERQAPEEALRADPGPPAEEALEVELGESDVARQAGQSGLALPVARDEADARLDERVV